MIKRKKQLKEDKPKREELVKKLSEEIDLINQIIDKNLEERKNA